jgi:hypothetical protein
MSSLVRSALFGLFLSAGPLLAAPVPLPAKYDPPTAVGQVASLQTVLDTVMGYARAFSPETADQMQAGLTNQLGEKGWAGIDMKKPVGMFTYLKPKLEDSYIVLVVPISKEKDALELLERLGVGAEEEPKAKGVYRLRQRAVLPEATPTRMRFHDGHAYVGINADADELDTTKLLPIGSLIDDTEKAPAAVTFYPARAPKELKEMFDGWWAGGKAGLDQLDNNPPRDMPRNFPAFGKAALGWLDANSTALFKGGESVRVRLTPDPKTTDAKIELVVTPKAKSPLAADIEKLTPAPGRFHQLVTKDAVAGVWLTVGPNFPKEVREKGGPFAGDLLGMIVPSAPEEVQPVLTALSDGLSKAVADGKADAGVALLGPDKNGAYTLIGAVAMADPTGLEKAVRKAVKDAPKEVQEMFKLDAEKAGDVAVHTFTPPEGSEWVERVLGKKPVIRLAFGKDAVYAAAGPDGLEQIKRAVALKATGGKRFDVVANPKKLNKLIADQTGGGGGQEGFWLNAIIGQEDGLRSYFGIDAKGGKELTITYTQHRTGILFSFGFMAFRVGGL